jgi:hypothetical protein
MELEKTKVRIRCEIGACKKPADYTVKLSRVGIRSRIHICTDCLKELSRLAMPEFNPPEPETAESAPAAGAVPKSIETLKPKRKSRV